MSASLTKPKKRHVCTYRACTKAFSKPSLLRAHTRVHTGIRPFLCTYPQCDKSFRWRSGLSYHQQTHLRDDGIPCRRFSNTASSNALHTPPPVSNIDIATAVSYKTEMVASPPSPEPLSLQPPAVLQTQLSQLQPLQEQSPRSSTHLSEPILDDNRKLLSGFDLPMIHVSEIDLALFSDMTPRCSPMDRVFESPSIDSMANIEACLDF